MSAQLILRIAGIAALVVAALFVALAIHYYVTNHIGEVMDDLSGKARARGVADLGGRAPSGGRRRQQARGREAARGAKQAPAVTKGTVEPAPVPALFETGAAAADDALAPCAPGMANFPAAGFADGEDDMETMVVEADFSTALGEAQNEASTSASLAGKDMWDKTVAGTFAFCMTRSIVLCDSDKIIASGEGM